MRRRWPCNGRMMASPGKRTARGGRTYLAFFWVCVCSSMCRYTGVCVCKGQRTTSGVIPQAPSTLFSFETESRWPGIHRIVLVRWLVSSRDLPVSTSPGLRSNSGPHAGPVKALATELSPQLALLPSWCQKDDVIFHGGAKEDGRCYLRGLLLAFTEHN